MKNRVIFRLRGQMLEKFVAQAVREGVFFETVDRITGQEMRLTAPQRQAERLVLLAEKYRMDLTMLREEGLPYWKRRLRERGSLVLGLLLGLLLVSAAASRIWRVEAVSLDGMVGGETLDSVGRFVMEQGARPGAACASVDREALALAVYEKWPEFTHVSVRRSGVCLRVEVAVEESVPELYDADASRDLVAGRDAVILYVEPLAGQAAVKPGDTVRRGQVLIRGEERTDAEQTRGVRALGKVLARVWFTGACELPLTETVSEYTGQASVSTALRLGKWEWEIVPAAQYPFQETQEELVPLGGLFLLVRLARTVRREIRPVSVERPFAELLAEGGKSALDRARAMLPDGAEETASWTESETAGGMLIVRATVEAKMDIASERASLADGVRE